MRTEDKPDLLLLHGALGSSRQFNGLKENLNTDFNLWVPDFPGHGDNNDKGEFSIDRFAESLFEFIEAHLLVQAHIFGYSMGGYVALRFAEKYPERCGNIITLGTKFDWTPEFSASEEKKLVPELIESKIPKFAARLAELHGDHRWKILVERTAVMMNGLGNGWKLSEKELSKITQPVLITAGDSDNMVSTEESQWAAKSVQNGKFRLMEGFVHPIEKIDHDLMAETIGEFLTKNPQDFDSSR